MDISQVQGWFQSLIEFKTNIAIAEFAGICLAIAAPIILIIIICIKR